MVWRPQSRPAPHPSGGCPLAPLPSGGRPSLGTSPQWRVPQPYLKRSMQTNPNGQKPEGRNECCSTQPHRMLLRQLHTNAAPAVAPNAAQRSRTRMLLRQLQPMLVNPAPRRLVHPSNKVGWFTPAPRRLVHPSNKAAGSPQHPHGWFTPAYKRLVHSSIKAAGSLQHQSKLVHPSNKVFRPFPTTERLVHPSNRTWADPRTKPLISAPKLAGSPSTQTAGSPQHPYGWFTPATKRLVHPSTK